MALTIPELKKRKIILEEEIFKLLSAFEKENKVKVSYIDLLRKREDDKDEDSKGELMASVEYKPGILKSVDVRVDYLL